MKKLLVILFLAISIFSFAQTGKATPSATQTALDESNKLLQQALDKINALEKEKELLVKENESLKKINLDLQASLAEASNALKESNEILQKASDRIDKDQLEINSLRKSIEDLIKAGVEVQYYQWEIGVMVGYPLTAKLAVTWDPKWIPYLGFSAGFEYYFDTEKAGVFLGVKVNLK